MDETDRSTDCILCLTPFNATLKDGWTAHVRQVAPQDRSAVAEGFESVSPRSRRLRYLSGHPTLTDAELDAITRSDGLLGFAIGAELKREDAAPEPAGIARYVRNTPDADEAEIALTIADRFHRLGLASVLLGALAKHAAHNGVTRWRALVSRQNTPAINLFEAMGALRADDAQTGDITFLLDLSKDGHTFPATSTGDRVRNAYALTKLTREN